MIELDEELQAKIDKLIRLSAASFPNKEDHPRFPFFIAFGLVGWTLLWFACGFVVRGMM